MMVSLSGSAGDTIEILDSTGTVLASMKAGTAYECVVASTAGMVEDGTYTVTNGPDSVGVTLEGLSYSSSGTSAMAGAGQGRSAPSGMGSGMGGSGADGSLSTQSADASSSSSSELKA
jgi:hypothetical protein